MVREKPMVREKHERDQGELGHRAAGAIMGHDRPRLHMSVL
jgi:hypothetical protein